MQYEFPHFRVDRKDWLKGSNSYEHYPDGGFLTSSVGFSAFAKPGWLTLSPDYGLSLDGTLPFGIGISWAWGKGLIGQESMVVGVDNSQNGYFYQRISGSNTLNLIGSVDSSHTYQKGKTDSAFYKGQFYTTSVSDITVQNYDLTSRDTSWWVTTHGKTSLDAFSPHPLLVYGDILQIGDGRYIHQNDNGNIQYAALDLGQDWVITAMVQYNNLIYIAAEPYYNFFGNYTGGAKIFTWDGYSDSFLDEYFVDLRVNTMYVFKNILYIWNNNAVNYFTGTAIKPLYPVSNQVLKSMVTSTSDSLFFLDGTEIIRYGSPYLTGSFRFHHFSSLQSTGNGLLSSYLNGLAIYSNGATAGQSYYMTDVNANPAGNKQVRLNPREFPRPVKVRGYVLHTDFLATGYVELSYVSDGDFSFHATKRFAASDSAMLNKGRWRFDVNSEPATTEIGLVLTIAGANYVKAIDVLYEPSENKLNR